MHLTKLSSSKYSRTITRVINYDRLQPVSSKVWSFLFAFIPIHEVVVCSIEGLNLNCGENTECFLCYFLHVPSTLWNHGTFLNRYDKSKLKALSKSMRWNKLRLTLSRRIVALFRENRGKLFVYPRKQPCRVSGTWRLVQYCELNTEWLNGSIDERILHQVLYFGFVKNLMHIH